MSMKIKMASHVATMKQCLYCNGCVQLMSDGYVLCLCITYAPIINE